MREGNKRKKKIYRFERKRNDKKKSEKKVERQKRPRLPKTIKKRKK